MNLGSLKELDEIIVAPCYLSFVCAIRLNNEVDLQFILLLATFSLNSHNRFQSFRGFERKLYPFSLHLECQLQFD
jgi:hypothetical protein